MMNIYAVPPLITAGLFLVLGLFAYFRSESSLKGPYSFLCLLTAAWQASWTVLFDTHDAVLADIIIKIGYSAIIFIPFAYYHFIAKFSGIKKAGIKVLYGIGVVFLGLHLSTTWIVDSHYQYFFGFYPKHGPLHPLYLLTLFSMAIATSFYLFLAWRRAKTPKRLNQVKYIAISFGIYCLAVSDFLVNYNLEFYPFGVYCIATSLAIMGYAMARHELLDIRIVVKKTLYYSALLGLLIVPLLPVFYLTERFAPLTMKYFIFTIVLIVVGFLFPKIRVGAGRNLDNMLFGERVDYRKAFSELAREISHLQPLEDLLAKVNDTISWAINVDAVAIYYRDIDSHYFRAKASHGDPGRWPRDFHQDMVKVTSVANGINNYSLHIHNVGNDITRIPVVFENTLIAFILIENNLSAFSQDEILILSTIANQLAVAINNSQQFDAINALNANLEATIAERTRELQKAYDELKQLSHVKDEFFNRISHELRTPLSNIMMPIEAVMISHGAGMDPANFQEKRSILRNAAILMKRINEILDIAKLESGKMTLRAQKQDINDILEEVISAATMAAKQLGLKLVFNKAPTNPLYLDADKVERVFTNIISNAMKFTESGGAIEVKTTETHDDLIVSISDSGCGIPQDQLEKIFEPFQQADTKSSRRVSGTGLGLAIARDFVELHGGSISVVSSEGQGTTFKLTFKRGKAHLLPEQIITDNVRPIAERRNSERRVSADRRAQEAAIWDLDETEEFSELVNTDRATSSDSEYIFDPLKKTVLVVEDNVDLLANIRSALASEFNVLEAENGVIGLAKAEEHKPDIVISDIMMPEMDGIALCSHLRRHPELIYTPIILLTAKVSVESRVQGLKTGADYYLEKPFNIKELITVINLLLTKKDFQEALLSKNEQINNAYQQLELATQEVRNANQAKSAFVASMSHEVRTPLNAIIGYSEILLEESKTDGLDDYTNDLEKIIISSKHLLSLINTVLDISKIEAGKMTLHLEKFALGSVLNDIKNVARPLVMVNNNKFMLSIDEDLKYLCSDEVKFKQIVMNLISNAAKFTNQGVIQLRASKLVTQGRDYVRLEVEDSGIGLTPEQIDKLFSEYTQAETSTSKAYGGTGLGLSLSKKLCELLGGTMNVTSTVQEGSIFSFIIPVVHDDYRDTESDNDDEAQSNISF